MYEIKTQAFFSAAHHLLNYDGECENQHGHNWMVEAFVQGESLNKSNILIDYKVLKLKERIVQLSKITVWETQTSCCSYFEAE